MVRVIDRLFTTVGVGKALVRDRALNSHRVTHPNLIFRRTAALMSGIASGDERGKCDPSYQDHVDSNE
jgi:hypothetical protein